MLLHIDLAMYQPVRRAPVPLLVAGPIGCLAELVEFNTSQKRLGSICVQRDVPDFGCTKLVAEARTRR